MTASKTNVLISVFYHLSPMLKYTTANNCYPFGDLHCYSFIRFKFYFSQLTKIREKIDGKDND